MALELSENQRKIVESRNTDILVSAAAGSGKTFVLAKRILDIVRKDNVDIDQLLVLTFTRKAAGEMKERIAKFINEELLVNPDDEFLRRQSVLIHRSFITTIDSFCATVVKNHFAEIGLNPNISNLDEAQNVSLQNQILADLFEEKYALPEDSKERIEFINALESVHQAGDDKNLAELILDIDRKADSFPNPEEWLLNAKNNFISGADADFFKKDWVRWLINDGEKAVLEVKNLLDKALEIADTNELTVTLNYVQNTYDTLEGCGLFDAFSNTPEGNEQFIKLMGTEKPSFEAMRAKDKTGEDGKELAATARALRNKAKEIVEKHIWANCFSFSFELASQDIKDTALLVSGLINLTLEFRSRMASEKERMGVATFGDIAHYALRILLSKDANGNYVPTETAREYREYFKYVMIDEYQDSNLIQEELLKAISGSDEGNFNRFCVGDIKQSIYRFRQACPDLILEKMETHGDTAPKLRIDLQENYRSRAEVLECCNSVFEKIMKKDFGGVEYDASQRLYVGNKFYLPAENMNPEFFVSEYSSYEGDKDKLHIHMLAKIVKDCVANVKVSCDKEVTEGEKTFYPLRPAQYGDIAILFRGVTKYAHNLIEIFKAYGIPVDIKDSVSLYEMPEIMPLVDYLKIIDNPLQDISFLSALKAFAGVTDTDAALLVAGNQKTPLYLLAKKSEKPNIKKFIENYETVREKAAHLTVAETISMVLNVTGYESIVSATQTGDTAILNIRLLVEKAKQFDENYALGINTFVDSLEKSIEADKETGAAPASSVENAVRIMTMHASKGLEFPICILGGLQKQYNEDDLKNNFMIDSDLGLAARYFNVETREKRDTLIRKTFARKAKLAGRAEELRILYVAMTRAREKLILAANYSMSPKERENGTPAQEAFMNKYLGKLGADDCSVLELEDNNNLMDCVLSGFGKYESAIKVYTSKDIFGESVDAAVEAVADKERLLEASLNEDAKPKNLLDMRSVPYSHSELTGLVRKVSVSEIKAREQENKLARMDMENMEDGYLSGGVSAESFLSGKKNNINNERYVPTFIERTEEKISGADIGTATHRLMQTVKFGEVADVQATLEKLVEAEVIKKELASKIDIDEITKFTSSELGTRMAAADEKGNLYRELPFFMQIEASRFNLGPSSEKVLVQGIADVVFEEADGLILLDYKTDKAKSMSELADKYGLQLDLYAEAISRALGRPVIEKHIYSFHLGNAIKL